MNAPTNPPTCPDMPLRDYFAGQALVALLPVYLERVGFDSSTGMNCSIKAYGIADAMLAARERNVR